MAREKKDGVKVSLICEREIWKNLTSFCDATGRTKTRVVEMAIQEYLESHKDKVK